MVKVRKRERLLAAASTALLAVLINVLFAAPVAATVAAVGYWSYPIFLVINVTIAAFVLGVLLPNDYGDWTKRLPTWARNGLVWLRRVVSVDEAKIEAGWFGKAWKWIKGKGAFWAILAVSLLTTTPAAGAALSRTLKLPERKAWLYSMVSAVVFTGISISIYLGLVAGILAWVTAVFS